MATPGRLFADPAVRERRRAPHSTTAPGRSTRGPTSAGRRGCLAAGPRSGLRRTHSENHMVRTTTSTSNAPTSAGAAGAIASGLGSLSRDGAAAIGHSTARASRFSLFHRVLHPAATLVRALPVLARGGQRHGSHGLARPLVLGALFVFLTAVPVRAQVEVWSATLTPGTRTNEVGCSDGFSNTALHCSALLDGQTFTLDGVEHTVTALFHLTIGPWTNARPRRRTGIRSRWTAAAAPRRRGSRYLTGR